MRAQVVVRSLSGIGSVTERFGNFSYTLTGLTAGKAYSVRLHFAEIFWNAPGKRKFNVSINGTAALTNFDTFQAAGASNKAIVQTFSTIADSQGRIIITFTTVLDNAKVSGIDVTPV